MPTAAKITLWIGIIFFILSILNYSSVENISPALQRSEALASLASVLLMLIASLWTEILPKKPKEVKFKEKQGFIVSDDINQNLQKELAWGSHMILTSTPAITILIYWNNKTILRRGFINHEEFNPGKICERSIETGKLISLVNTVHYPGKDEFDNILKDLPSIIIYPLQNKGLIIVGGISERCFTTNDQKWISGWGDKIKDELDQIKF